MAIENHHIVKRNFASDFPYNVQNIILHNLTDSFNWRQVQEFKTTNLVIIFWQFTVLKYKFELPQVKRDFISSTTDFDLPHEVPNGLKPRILGN